MRAEHLLRAVGEVDDALIYEADQPLPRRKPTWQRYGAMAACALLVITLGARVLPGSMGGGAAPSTGADSGTAKEARGENTSQASYAGPSSGMTEYSTTHDEAVLLGKGSRVYFVELTPPLEQLPEGSVEVEAPDTLPVQDPAQLPVGSTKETALSEVKWFRSPDGTTYLQLDGQYYPVILP